MASDTTAENAARRKVLQLELARGCVDDAVVTGMDRWIEKQAVVWSWLRQVSPLDKRRYADLSVDERRVWIKDILKRLAVKAGTAGAEVSPLSVLDKSLMTWAKIPYAMRSNLQSALNSLGVATIRDILWYVPREHRDLSNVSQIGQARPNEDATIRAQVVRIARVKKGHIPATEAVLKDVSGVIDIVWFGNPYIARAVTVGDEMMLSGKVSVFNGRKQMQNPEYESIGKLGDMRRTNTGGQIPFYSSSDAVSQKMIRYATRKALDCVKNGLRDWLPPAILSAQGLIGIEAAFEAIHYPADKSAFRGARRRLVFDELLFYQLSIQSARLDDGDARNGVAVARSGVPQVSKWLLDKLGFQFTQSQAETLRAIADDMAGGTPMSRLIQGEVGSGKTIVALAAMLAVNATGCATAILAPTEVLAEQHFMNVMRILEASPLPKLNGLVVRADFPPSESGQIKIAFLVGKRYGASRRRMLEMLNAGEIDLVIGTHAIIQAGVAMPRLGLAVIDEQHRFGVQQRGFLMRREPKPHLLAMSATPIPRTLQLTVYGEMNISTMRQLPQGKRRVRTRLINTELDRAEAYGILRSEVKAGRKAFVVCPFIEESDSLSDVRAVEVEFERLKQGELRDLKLGLLNGKMTLLKKQRAIDEFRLGITEVLVTTPVVEVGVDIPDATVMLIESAERFGLSQLHQLRGRIGRSGLPGWCMLATDKLEGDAKMRLETARDLDDGFELAEADLELRGPGDYLGTRQSGWARMRIARPHDVKSLTAARDEAVKLLKADPKLRKHPLLKREMELFGVPEDVSAMDETL